tara:strand:- start:17478 stop:17657 length:180 start_codon:yes stop_codon:yes gene_type:complete
MNIVKMKKQLQLKKFENSLFELDIKIAERQEDINRIETLKTQEQERILILKEEINNLED